MKVVNKFLCGWFFCGCLVLLTQTVYPQTPMPPPPTLIIEGAEKLPEELYKDYQRSADWTCANFLGWTADKRAIGYNEYFDIFRLNQIGYSWRF